MKSNGSIRKMNGRELTKKIENILYLYKLQIILIGIGVLLAGYFLNHFMKPSKNVLLEVLFVNFYDDVSQSSEFSEGFAGYIGLEEKDKQIVFDNGFFFDLSKESDYMNSYYQKAVAYLEAKTADAVICQRDNLTGLAGGGRLMDLRDKRTANLYEKYKDRILTIEKEGSDIPVGIDVTESCVWNKMTGYEGKCYLGISAYTQRFDMLEKFLEYLFL